MWSILGTLGLVVAFGALILRLGQPPRLQAYLGENSEEVD